MLKPPLFLLRRLSKYKYPEMTIPLRFVMAGELVYRFNRL